MTVPPRHWLHSQRKVDSALANRCMMRNHSWNRLMNNSIVDQKSLHRYLPCAHVRDAVAQTDLLSLSHRNVAPANRIRLLHRPKQSYDRLVARPVICRQPTDWNPNHLDADCPSSPYSLTDPRASSSSRNSARKAGSKCRMLHFVREGSDRRQPLEPGHLPNDTRHWQTFRKGRITIRDPPLNCCSEYPKLGTMYSDCTCPPCCCCPFCCTSPGSCWASSSRYCVAAIRDGQPAQLRPLNVDPA